MNILSLLRDRFATALAAELPAGQDLAPLLDMIRPAQDPKFGDYQANFAMSLGKQLGRPPRDIAQSVAARVDVSDVCQPPEVAGPGFINLRLRDDWLAAQFQAAAADDRLGIPPVASPRTYVIDYSSPNVAKSMHVGHIRSTVIGDAVSRTLRFLGHRVISDNHLGDWGTQFGMIIYGYKHFLDRAAYEQKSLDELGRLYRVVRRLMDYEEAKDSLPKLAAQVADREKEVRQLEEKTLSLDPPTAKKEAKELRRQKGQLAEQQEKLAELHKSIAELEADPTMAELAKQHAGIGAAVLQETAKLHAGDEENTRIWREVLPRCQQDVQHIYDRLDVRFDYELGESFYHDQLAGVVDDFLQRGLAEISQGAVCVFLDGYETPMIIRKQDGAFLYSTTDLATIRYRVNTWQPDEILYVVDFRQGEHFGKLFAAARLWGYEKVKLQHVSFGTVLGDDGRPFRTRAGDTVGLEGLLDEAVRRAYLVVSQNDDAKPDGPELPEAQRRHIAEVVGIAALKYADLSQNRSSDYVFSYDKMLALNGNTATYMQYAYARVRNIFVRGGVDADELRTAGSAILLDHPAERSLALRLLRLAEALDETVADYRPHMLTSYLFDVAEAFSTFYNECPVLKAETEQQRTSRLLLSDLTARTLKQGLEMLGIRVVEKM